MRIDRVLAAASGTWGVSEAILADRLSAIESVGALQKEQARFISERQRGSAQPMIEGLGAMVGQYRALPGSRSSRPALASTAIALPAI